MIDRYCSAEMAGLWSEAVKFEYWSEIEQRVLEFVHDIRVKLPSVTVASVAYHELTTRHDVAAYLVAVREQLPADQAEVARLLHAGLTSSDLVDTATGCRMFDSNWVILRQVQVLHSALNSLYERHGDQPVMGRTHGQHAEPMTLGHQIRAWMTQVYRVSRRLYSAEFYGKVSGATGQNLTVTEKQERAILRSLALHRARYASQVVPRWHYEEWYGTLAGLAGLCLQVANWVRLSSIEGIDEVYEGNTPGQVGSTAMPHKQHNPIRSEQIVGLARHARRLAHELSDAGHELWWQRDLTHSGLERLNLPDLCALSEYLPTQTAALLDGLELNTERMARRADTTSSAVLAYNLLINGNSLDFARETAARIHADNQQEATDVAQLADPTADRIESGNHQPSPDRRAGSRAGDDGQDRAGTRVAHS